MTPIFSPNFCLRDGGFGWPPFIRIGIMFLAVITLSVCVTSPGMAQDRTAARVLETAQQVHQSGESLASAVPHLNRLVRHDDPHVRAGAALFLGHALWEDEKIADAVELWKSHNDRAVLTEGPWWVPLRLAEARGRHQQGDQQGALVLLDDLIKEFASTTTPDIVQAAALAGHIHAAQGHPDRARRSWRWAKDYARSNFSDPSREGLDLAAIRRAIRELNQGEERAETAEDVFAQAERQRQRERWSSALERYRHILEHYPDSAYVYPSHWAIGRCLLGKGEVESAVQHWQKFIDENPSGPWRGPAFMSLGDFLLEELLHVRKASHYYTTAQKHFEEGAGGVAGWESIGYSLYQRLGLLAYLRDDRNEAIQWFERASRMGAPRLHEAGEGSGTVLSAMDVLIGYLRDGNDVTPAQVRRPGNGGALLCLLGDIYGSTHEVDQAQRMYQRVIDASQASDWSKDGREGSRIAPTPAQVSWAHRGLGNVQYVGFDFAAAQEHFAACLEIAPRAPWAPAVLLRRGVIAYSCQSQPEEALQHYRRIVRDFPRNEKAEVATYFIAVLHHWEGHYDTAERYYRQFLRRYPRSAYAGPVVHNHLPELKQERAQSSTD